MYGHPDIDEPAFHQDPPNGLIRDKLNMVIWKRLREPPQSWNCQDDVPQRSGVNDKNGTSHTLSGWTGFRRVLVQQPNRFKISGCIHIEERMPLRIDFA